MTKIPFVVRVKLDTSSSSGTRTVIIIILVGRVHDVKVSNTLLTIKPSFVYSSS